jgi:5-methylthioribose kinase
LGIKDGRRKNKRFDKITEAAKPLQSLALGYMMRDTDNTAALSRWILDLPQELCDISIKLILSETLFDDEVNKYDRLRLLIIQWCARQLKLWTDTLGPKGHFTTSVR